MSDMEILKSLLKESATQILQAHPYDPIKKQLKLEEPDPSGNYFCVIDGMPDDAAVSVIKADEFVPPKAVFSNTRGECKRADFVIIVNDGSRKAIIYIEMKAKSATSSEVEIVQQLKGAHCFISYCREIGRMYWDAPDFLDGYKERYVSIRNISVTKKSSREKPKTGIHDSPERMLKISSPHHLQLNQLIG